MEIVHPLLLCIASINGRRHTYFSLTSEGHEDVTNKLQGNGGYTQSTVSTTACETVLWSTFGWDSRTLCWDSRWAKRSGTTTTNWWHVPNHDVIMIIVWCEDGYVYIKPMRPPFGLCTMVIDGKASKINGGLKRRDHKPLRWQYNLPVSRFTLEPCQESKQQRDSWLWSAITSRLVFGFTG